MCGRFVLFTTGDDLLDAVATLPPVSRVEAPDGTPGARYNIAPTHHIPLVRLPAHQPGVARLEAARWGLLPAWKQDMAGAPLFNARGETLAQKPSFREAMRNQRGLLLLDGYYEWRNKVPYYVTSRTGMLVAAALWDTGLARLSTTMVTTEAAPRTAWLHHRLPLFLQPDEVEQWACGSAAEAAQLIAPSRVAPHLEWVEVGQEVGNVRNEGPRLIQPVSTPPLPLLMPPDRPD